MRSSWSGAGGRSCRQRSWSWRWLGLWREPEQPDARIGVGFADRPGAAIRPRVARDATDSAPAPPSPSTGAQPSPSGVAISCDPATVKQLEQAVSHEWAAQGATHDQLVALNLALFTCYFGARASQCDIVSLAELQLSIGAVEANGGTPPVEDQTRYADILATCLGQRQPARQPPFPRQTRRRAGTRRTVPRCGSTGHSPERRS